jgi:hypothetical protein
MRFNEIASAEEQLALWRLISSNVWSILNSQVTNRGPQPSNKSNAKLRPPKAVAARKKQLTKKPPQPAKLPKPTNAQSNTPPQSSTLDAGHPISGYRSPALPNLPGSSGMSQKEFNDLQQQFQKNTGFN